MSALLRVATAALENLATRLSENTKTLPQRAFYRGYAQGVRDGVAGAEHALKWLARKDQTWVISWMQSMS